MKESPQRFRPYPDRRATGVEWLGEAPAHWGLKRAKFQFQRMQRPVRPDDEIVTAFRDGVVTLRNNRRTEGYTFASKEIGYQGVREGDLIVHAMDGFAGAIGVSDSNGKATPVYAVMTALPDSPAEPRFHAYLLRHLALAGYVTSLAKGIRERSTEFRYKEVKELWLPTMPRDEQRAIADFLDRETEKIDTLVAKKERLIELLQEKRTALIIHAVTKGLDPTVPMKPSGVEWLEEIPAHWHAERLKTTMLGCQNGVWGDEPGGGDDIACIRVADFDRASLRIRINDLTLRSVEARVARPRLLNPGDLLIEKSGGGEKQLVGAVVFFDHDIRAVCSNFIARITVAAGHEPRFLCYLHAGAYALRLNLRSVKQSTGIQNLDTGSYFDERVPIPPLGEQYRISKFLDRKVENLEALERKIKEAIQSLTEFRTALISAAVTGKIDVREETPAA